jgi:hypothetical protein
LREKHAASAKALDVPTALESLTTFALNNRILSNYTAPPPSAEGKTRYHPLGFSMVGPEWVGMKRPGISQGMVVFRYRYPELFQKNGWRYSTPITIPK